jgi:hypothetical protein
VRAQCEPYLSKSSVEKHKVPIKLCPMSKVFGECADSADRDGSLPWSERVLGLELPKISFKLVRHAEISGNASQH